MSEKEIKQYLTDNLEIKTCYKEEYEHGIKYKILEIRLLLDGCIISACEEQIKGGI